MPPSGLREPELQPHAAPPQVTSVRAQHAACPPPSAGCVLGACSVCVSVTSVASQNKTSVKSNRRVLETKKTRRGRAAESCTHLPAGRCCVCGHRRCWCVCVCVLLVLTALHTAPRVRVYVCVDVCASGGGGRSCAVSCAL